MSRVTEVRLTIAAFIYAIEEDLRDIIKTKIIPYISDFGFVQNAELVKIITLRYLKDNPGADPEKNIEEVMDFLDFGDSYKIILKNNHFIPDNAFASVKALSKHLEAIIPVRNRVMHTRPLLGDDFLSVFGVVTEIRASKLGIWKNVSSTFQKIEDDPAYVLSFRLKNYDISEYGIEHNLPYPDFDETGFIGRVKDIETVKHLILNTNVVSVIGDGGIGKTALMLKVAYDIVDMKDECPFEIIVWISAKTTVLTTKGIEAIANSLRESSDIIKGVAQKFEKLVSDSYSANVSTIIQYLDSFKVLLIIDNLETVQTEDMREFIRVAQTKCKIAITSRIGLGELEYPVKLDGLSDNESVKMIREIARLRNDNYILKLPTSTLVDISNKLYHNPLALKWFVNSVNAGKTLNEVLQNKDDLLKFLFKQCL